VLHIHHGSELELLADHLAELYATPPPDVMEREWVAVPSVAMGRWLMLRLAGQMGTGGHGRHDGVAANITIGFPGSLRLALLESGRTPHDPDPWQVEMLTWTVIELLTTRASLRDRVTGGSLYRSARRIADLFDRYHLHRPEMISHWAQGRLWDGAGRPLPEHELWQAELWSACRERLDLPSPPERMGALLDAVRDGSLVLDLPRRIALWGLTSLPGGASFTELCEAVAIRRELHLYIVTASPSLCATISEIGSGAGRENTANRVVLRSEDRSASLVRHPLLRSWGRTNRESLVMLASTSHTRLALQGGSLGSLDPADTSSTSTMLSRLQGDIRANRPPDGAFGADLADGSIQLHACQGVTRQVEVARDTILHLLADSTDGLTEDDIVVCCPALDQIAPVIEAVFGPSAAADDELNNDSGGKSGDAEAGPPALRYRIADRSVRTSNPVLEAMSILLSVVAGRFDVVAVMGLIAQAPVRRRFHLGDDDLGRITRLVGAVQVRWGIDASHRRMLGFEADLAANTWRSGLDQLIVGSTISGDGLSLAVGDVVPFVSSADEVAMTWQVAEILWRLESLMIESRTPRHRESWHALLADAASSLFETSPDDAWQLRELEYLLGRSLGNGSPWNSAPQVELDFSDVRRLVEDTLAGSAGRPDFFRGGVTVTSTTPLRCIPHRVVCLLGMDQSALAATATATSDDLSATSPRLGDRDPRSEGRQALLDAVLSAKDCLVIVRDGRDVRTNVEVPRAVAVAELVDALTEMVHPDERTEFLHRIEIVHPRQSFDERCFLPGGLIASARTLRPWSFDPMAMRSAQIRRSRRVGSRLPFLAAPLDPPVGDGRDVDLAELHEFFHHPVRFFLRRRLGARLPSAEDVLDPVLPIALHGLDKWGAGTRLLEALLDGHEVEQWARVEERRGTLPPGVLGAEAIVGIQSACAQLVGACDALGVRRGVEDLVPIELVLPDGTRLSGTVPCRLSGAAPGPARVSFAQARPRLRVAAWLDLMALSAAHPSATWRSVTINRGPDSRGSDSRGSERRGSDTSVAECAEFFTSDGTIDPTAALSSAVELLRRAYREPLPIFDRVSYDLAHDKSAASSWRPFNGNGDGDDDSVNIAFGEISLTELLDLPPKDGDPSGSGGRVERYARHLWSTIESSMVESSLSGSAKARW